MDNKSDKTSDQKPNPILAYHCHQLLLEHEKAWLEYQHRQADAFTSNTIQWNGRPYDCASNTCTKNCLWDASLAHQKCKCRQLYVQGQSHLQAPCDATASQGSELTYDVCKKLGYLDPELSSGTKLDASLGAGLKSTKPIWPAITCDACKSEFQDLQRNYTPFNYQKTLECIQKLQHPDPPSTTISSFMQYFKWIIIGFVILIIITGWIGYKMWSKQMYCKPVDIHKKNFFVADHI